MIYNNDINTTASFSFGQWFLIISIIAYSVGNLWLYSNVEAISNGWASILTYGNIGSYLTFGLVYVFICLKSWDKSPLLVFSIAFLTIAIAGSGIILNFELASKLAFTPTHKLAYDLYLLIYNAVIAMPGLCFAIMLFRIINTETHHTGLIKV